MSKGLSIVIPAYNEEKSVGSVIEEIQRILSSTDIPFEIIVVDDKSTDNTRKAITGYDVKLIEHQFNKGYGASIISGVKKARFDHIGITDADRTYPNEKIPELYRYTDEFDMVVGARTGKDVHIPMIRRPAKWVLNKLANFLTETVIPDLNSGLRIIKKELVLKYQHILPTGFSLTSTITMALLCDKYEVKYIPINYKKRVGKSKIKSRNAIDFLLLLIRTSIYFNPLKFFLPVSFMFVLLSCAVVAYDAVILKGLTDKSIVISLFTVMIIIFGLLADLIVRKR